MVALRLCLLSAAVAVLFTLPAMAASGQDDAASRSDLSLALDRLQDVITDLAGQESLTRAETDSLRRELAGLYQQLDAVRDRIGAGAGAEADEGDESRAGVWTRFGGASLQLTPPGVRFDGWSNDNNITMDHQQSGSIVVTIHNGGYTATWLLLNAYSGGVKTTVTTKTNGDLVLHVDDTVGSREFLIKDGGLGPIYVRGDLPATGSKSTSPVRTASTWYRPWREAVERRELTSSSGMDWLIQQYQDNAYVSDNLQAVGDMLRGLEGQPIVSDALGRLYFYRNGERYFYDIPDPRREPSDFAFIAGKLYDLERSGDRYDIAGE